MPNRLARRPILFLGIAGLSLVAGCGGSSSSGSATAPITSASSVAAGGGSTDGGAAPTGSAAATETFKPTSTIPITASTGTATAAEVVSLVAAAPQISSVPKDVDPSIANAPNSSETASGCDMQPSDVKVPDCEYGDLASKMTMVLLGDSHAGMYLPTFDLIARRAHWRLVFLSKSGCHVPDLSFYDEQNNRPYTNCDAWHKESVARINTLHADLVVVTSATEARLANKTDVSDAQWQAGLTASLNEIHATKKVVLGDLPLLSQSGPDCLAAHQSKVSACTTPASTAVQAGKIAAEMAAAKATGATYINVTPWLCSAICTPIIGNMVVYRNQYHLTAVYALYLTSVIQAELPLAG